MGLLKKLKKAVVGGVKGFITSGGNPWGAAAGAAGGLFSGGGGGGGSGQSPNAPGFTPYSIKSGYGTSTINEANKTATYELTPEMKAFRDKFYAGATGAMPSAEQTAYASQVSNYGMGLFDQATNMDIGAMTQDYLAGQINLLEPGRAQESSRLNDLQFSRGTTGQGIGMGGGYVNPQQYALAMAREQQNAALAVGAEDRARSIQADTLTQAGALYGLGQSYATQPYETANTLFGYGSNVEALGANTMAQGMNFGALSTGANQNAGQINAGINQTNYLNALYKSNATANQWGDLINSASNMDWGGLFGGSVGGTGSGNEYAGGKADWMYSDKRLKKNIKLIGKYKNGLNKYSWDYVWNEKGTGVMADEVEKVMPEAVRLINGYKAVNYALLGV
jgi:hypothetical protein